MDTFEVEGNCYITVNNNRIRNNTAVKRNAHVRDLKKAREK